MSGKQLAKQFRDVFLGGNWTDVNLKSTLEDVNWKQATTKIYDLNTIAALVFHFNYYVMPSLKVLRGEPLKASDAESFNLPPITSEEEWQELLTRIFAEAELYANELEILDDRKLTQDFDIPKYGDFYRNIAGLIEHIHYHLGQIVLIKKILRSY